MNYKFLFLFVFAVLLIGSVSAFEFDNIKTYNEETRTATFQNSIGAFGFGIPTSDIGDISLKSKPIEDLPTGYQRVARQQFKTYEDFLVYLKQENFRLINLTSGEEIYRKLDFKYAVYTEVEVFDYETQCISTGKKTNYGADERPCKRVEVGSHKELVEEWKDISEYTFKEGESVDVGIFTNVEYGDNIEWIPTYFGREVTEWAVWTSNLNTLLMGYYKLDESSGAVLDQLANGTSGVNGGATAGVAGKILTAYDFESTESDNISFTAPKWAFGGAPMSVNLWVKAESGGNNQIFVGTQTSGGWFVGKKNTNALIFGQYGATSCDSTGVVGVGGWNMVTVVYNSSGANFFLNGTKVDTIACSVSFTANLNYFFGQYVTGDPGYYDGILDEVGFWNRSLTQQEITETLWNAGVGLSYASNSTINQTSPANGTNFSIAQVTLNWTVTDAVKVSNTTLFIDGVANYTNTSGINGSYFVTQNYATGNHNWSIGAVNNASQVSNTTNFTFNVNAVISVTLNTPTNASMTNITTVTFNASGTAGSGNLVNATQTVWYSNGTIFNTTTIARTGATNSTNITIINFPVNTYLWNTQYCRDDGSCGSATTNNTFTVGSIQGTPLYNSTAYETGTQNISINITAFNATVPTNAFLNYNGTNYTATISSVGSGNYTLSRTLTSPITTVNTSVLFNFTWNVGLISETSTTQNQSINLTTLSYCSGNSASKYLNFSFQDEVNSSNLNGVFASSTFNYYAGTDNTIYKTLTYSNSTGANNVTFCSNTPFLPYIVDYNISYSATGYVQRSVSSNTIFASNTTVNRTLLLLSNADGQYVTFQVVNIISQAIQGVQVNASTTIGGVPTLVGSGSTGADGSITFFMNPNNAHTLNFSKEGYIFYSTSITPTQTTYTIQLASSTATNTTDYNRGIFYTVRPPTANYLSNGTLTNFNFTMNSSYWVLDSFGFTLVGNNGTILNSSSSSASIGTVNVYSNTSNYTYINMNFYWIINGTVTNGTALWYVYDSTSGNSWSISYLLTDFVSYVTTGDGLFGLDSDGIAMMLYLFIFLSTGISAYKFGLSSPAVSSGVILFLVAFVDVGLGLDSYINPAGAIPYFPTIFVALIMASFIFKEITQ